MRKNSLFLTVIAFVFLFSVTNVSAETSIFKPVSTENVLEKTLESNTPQRRYWLKITNNSRYDIYQLFVSSSEEERWGPDQLGDFVLRGGGGSYTLTDIVPGEYDIRFVDEDGDKCDLRNIQIFKNTSWALTTNWLVQCQGY